MRDISGCFLGLIFLCSPSLVVLLVTWAVLDGVELVVDKEAVFEGDMVRLACKVEARPQLVEYQWWVGGNEVEEARGAAEFLLEAARKRANS